MGQNPIGKVIPNQSQDAYGSQISNFNGILGNQ